jgi:tyrosyl-tRNA synthetase
VKFGKTEAGTVWLDPNLTSPYRFYQFWFNTDDNDVIKYLKFFTWLNTEEIGALEESVRTEPHTRNAQKELARRVTEMVHGQTELSKALRASEVLFGRELSGLSAADVVDIFADVPSTLVERTSFVDGSFALNDLLVTTGVASSKADAKRLVQSGAVSVNNRRSADPRLGLTVADFIDGQILVLKKGTRQYHVVKLQ